MPPERKKRIIAVKPIPDGYDVAIPYLFVSDGASAMEFYKQAFGATELLRLNGPGGKIGHAEMKIGNCMVWLADEVPEMGFSSPLTLGGAGVNIFLYVEDVDALFKQALAAGAAVVRPVEDQFYGDRVGTLKDPFGHVWSFATHTQDLSREELLKRASEFVKKADS
jgi:PhnB protein